MALPNQADYDKKTREFSGGAISFWSVPDGLLKATFPAPMLDRSAHNVTFSPDGKSIAFLMQHHVKKGFGVVSGGDLRVFDVQSKSQLWQQTSRNNMSWNDLTYSPDGLWVAVSTWNDCIELYDAQTGKLVTTLHSQWRDANWNLIMTGPAVRFTGDGKLLVLRGHHEIYVWNMDEVNAQFALGD